MVPPLTLPGRAPLSLDHRSIPRIVGILNVTPDSFSDGGRFDNAEAAVARAVEMAKEGADVIDVGGESTRPGARRVRAEEQKRRVLGVIRGAREELDRDMPAVAISIDTTLSEVAAAALDAGASIVNDVSAGREDPAILSLAADRGAPFVAMHMQGDPATMQDEPTYIDVVSEVEEFLGERAAAAEAAGLARSQIILDPGIGFGKTTEHNLLLLAHLNRLTRIGHPIMVGASRKRFIMAASPTTGIDPIERIGGTCATTIICVQGGVHLIRVHDVAPNRQAADVASAILGAR